MRYLKEDGLSGGQSPGCILCSWRHRLRVLLVLAFPHPIIRSLSWTSMHLKSPADAPSAFLISRGRTPLELLI